MTDKHPGALTCPFCNSTDLLDGCWYIDDEEVDAIECAQCKAGAPAAVWNERPSPWRYPPDMAEEGQRILMTYRVAGSRERLDCDARRELAAIGPMDADTSRNEKGDVMDDDHASVLLMILLIAVAMITAGLMLLDGKL